MTSANVLDVLYVEDDPALRGILRAILEMSPQLRVAAAVGSSVEALAWAADNVVDVALLDLALGADDVTGVELGHRLREMQPRAGIVILSQHTVPDFVSRLPRDQQRGWSFIEKRADLRAIYLVDVLLATARGLNVIEPGAVEARTDAEVSVIERLTNRQRQVMARAATGVDGPAIAARLDLAAGTVRQELSKAYQVLVPDPEPGTHLRTSAVLVYLREARSSGSEAW